jgi:hypothetical protein
MSGFFYNFVRHLACKRLFLKVNVLLLSFVIDGGIHIVLQR